MPERIQFSIGGIPADGNLNGSHFNFPVQQPKVGDEITIRIVETESLDEPERIYSPASNDADRG